MNLATVGEREVDHRFFSVRQRFACRLRRLRETPFILRGKYVAVRSKAFQSPADHAVIEVVPAQGGIAARREYFENAPREFQKRHVERAAAQIVDEVQTFGTVVEPVGKRCRRRFVQKPQNVETGQFCRILRRLALCIVKIRGHRDDRTHQFAAQARFGTSLKRFENLGGNFHRTFHTRRRHEAHHTVAVREPIGKRHVARDVLQPPADEALRAAHRI